MDGRGALQLSQCARTKRGRSTALFSLDAVGSYLFSLSVIDNREMRSCEVATVEAEAELSFSVRLTWDTPSPTEGSDLDLHLLHPLGSWNSPPFDAYSLNMSPDWGAPGTLGDPIQDIDDNDGGGPENIALVTPEGLTTAPITYQFGAYFWEGSSSPPDTTPTS